MIENSAKLWAVIALVGIGSFLLRLSFLGLIGDRKLPEWVLRHLRYTPVAVMPGLVAPLVLWPEAAGGDADPARLIAAGVALAIAMTLRNIVVAVVAAMGALYLAQYAIG